VALGSVLLTFVIAGWFVLPHWTGSPAGDPSLEAEFEPIVPDARPADATTTVTDQVRRGDTFSGLLVRNHLGLQDVARVLDINRRLSLFSPRSLRPGQELTLTRDDYGRLVRLSYRISAEETYVFESRNDSLVAWQVPVEREVRLRKFEGDIETTFHDAIHRAGGDTRLSAKVADIFAYDVDFLTEVHKGDRFSILVEERFADGQPVGYGEVLYGRYEGSKARTSAVWFASSKAPSKGGYYDLKGQALRKVFLKSPLNYRRISSTFNKSRYHPILKRYRPHHGVDYAAAEGTPVVAVADGTIEFAGWKGGYGRMLQVKHAGKRGSLYGHLSRLAKGMTRGARVSQGEVIGYVGKTGLATGPHLHFELHENGRQVNPLTLKNVPAEPIPASQQPEFQAYARGLEELDRLMLAGQVLPEFNPARMQVELASLQRDEPEIPSVR